MIGSQRVSLRDVLEAVVGKQKFTDPKHALWWIRLQEMRDHKCWNDDVNSLTLYPRPGSVGRGERSDDGTAGSDIKKFVEQVGVNKVGIMAMPKWGNGQTRASSARPRRRSASRPGRNIPRWSPTSSCSRTHPSA